MPNIIPQPAGMELTGHTFKLQQGAAITCPPASFQTAAFLAGKLRPATGFELPVRADAEPRPGDIKLEPSTGNPALGCEGYELLITPELVTLRAPGAAGLFYAVQTLRQMFPAFVDSQQKQIGLEWEIPCGTISDSPRYPWRGMMLDVSRHFFGVDVIKRLIDQLAYYKINTLHLHLSDDQGWRIMIESWPNLAIHGGSSSVNGDPAGYYTQANYREIIAYAQENHISIIPEIDMPGHTNAALASYAELNANGVAPSLYTGTRVGFSSFDVHKELTYQFIDDVIRELAAMTPGNYIHIGGDETHATPEADYVLFIERVQDIVRKHGKQVVGWDEIGKTCLQPGTITQFWWNKETLANAAAQGNKIIFSPANRAYLDMKYQESTPLGLTWTGSYIEVHDAYDWDPDHYLENVSPQAILGVEAALWTETVFTRGNLDYMVFPRLCSYAEIGWTPAAHRNWEGFSARLAAHGKRLELNGVQFYRSPQVDWE